MTIFAIWIRKKNIRRQLKHSLYKVDSIRFPTSGSGKAIWHIQYPGKKTRNTVPVILVKDNMAHLAPYTQSPDIMGVTSMPKDYIEILL